MQKALPELYKGHAPITLQNGFHDALEALEEWEEGGEEPLVSIDGHSVRISHVFVTMSACTDLMPLRTRAALETIIGKDAVRATGGTLYADAAKLAMASARTRSEPVSR